MTSETRIAYGSRVPRHGSSRACTSNQAMRRDSTALTVDRRGRWSRRYPKRTA
jgi:hypothetical protein